jgi:uncharacterized protein
MRTIGLISDTYGLVRAEVLLALRGVDLILHAGDIGGDDVLRALAAIAPVRAVRGDADAADDAGLEPRIDEKFEQVHVVVTHGHELVRPEPPRLVSAYMHADVIVYGHTRLPLITRAARRLVINPGAAGNSYLGTSPTVARLYIDGRQSDAQLMRLFPADPDELRAALDDEDQ